MRYYKRADRSLLMCASEMPDLTEISKEEYETEKSNVDKRIQTALSIADRHRPLTESEVNRLLIAKQINTLSVDDNTALRMVEFYPAWSAGQDYTAGYKVQHGGKLWRCVQDHTSQDGWEPEIAPSLWAKVLIPDETVVPEWEQPDSTNPYNAGDKVTHNGKTWISDVDNNVWEPGVYGWSEVST